MAISPRSSSLSYDLKTPRSEVTTPDGQSLEPALRVTSEEKLPDKDEGFGKELESGDGLATAITVQEDNPPPEGGRDWWVMLGSFLLTFCTFGLVNAWVFQCLYEESVLADTSPSAIAWIGSIQYALCLMPGLFSGRLFDLGYLHIPVAIASTVLSLATILVAECTKYWHFLVTQGLVTGLVTRRLSVTNQPGGLINPRAFKSIPYSLYVLGAFVGMLGMYTPLTFIDVSAIKTAHLDPNFAFYLVSITNAASLISRIGGGLCGDRVGVVNVLTGIVSLGAVMTFVWPTVTSKGGLVALVIAYGAASGGFIGLLSAPVAQLGDTADIGRRIGMMFTIVSIGALIGPPISGVIYAANDGFRQVGIYAGCMIAACAAIFMLVKTSAVGTWKGKF
ncbi:hypothetical protein FS837_009490 [Tulasnella sp. UAMH 9824]|nr:hypothetical protein FS837_009490 [Tulasnella sp. UAMH 9824]